MSAAPIPLTLAQARRIALHAQGFGRPRPSARQVTMRDVQHLITRLGQFQIDTINIVERAHYFPFYSRLGCYDKALVDRALSRPPRRLFEYWGHAASVIDIELQPALRWRMARNTERWGPGLDTVLASHPGLDRMVLDELATRGPLTARQIEYDQAERARDQWGWNWSAAKSVLESLFSMGQITSAGRNASFERLYDLPHKVIPGRVLDTPDPTDEQSADELVRRAAQALGVASATCLADYFRLRRDTTEQAITRLVSDGHLVRASVDGWKRPVWLWQDYVVGGRARVPRPVRARALVSPFDSLVFERRRAEELFGFHYRIEIYVPEPQRQYGYYVLPFLLDEELVARVDLKADRATSTLLVRAAWYEAAASASVERIAVELAAELGELAQWTGCERVVVQPRGDLAERLSAAVGSGWGPHDA
ncbi:YcaQ family DNA glycosylase [Tessaracoccus sp. SD287]|uniref:winged helix-turn-helix domain-containing protein n=1 Tax=Tessaracoccus sp. SD287 TaxID=2782008 RepID=UPI001A9768E0|nr:crosslink repair DNA glycosylase YcaQ family protein [Tessaracoccus sp. SD287]MBO1030906.1 YcaQ family DNA glycosylase [Tessaracoccus sp. SD287]